MEKYNSVKKIIDVNNNPESTKLAFIYLCEIRIHNLCTNVGIILIFVVVTTIYLILKISVSNLITTSS